MSLIGTIGVNSNCLKSTDKKFAVQRPTNHHRIVGPIETLFRKKNFIKSVGVHDAVENEKHSVIHLRLKVQRNYKLYKENCQKL